MARPPVHAVVQLLEDGGRPDHKGAGQAVGLEVLVVFRPGHAQLLIIVHGFFGGDAGIVGREEADEGTDGHPVRFL